MGRFFCKNKVYVRPLTVNDIPRVLEIIGENNWPCKYPDEQSIRARIAQYPAICFAAEVDYKVLGFATCFMVNIGEEETWQPSPEYFMPDYKPGRLIPNTGLEMLVIGNMLVSRLSRGAGIGGRLMKDILLRAPQVYPALSRFSIVVNSDNRHAKVLCEKNGFEERARYPDFFRAETLTTGKNFGILMTKARSDFR